MEHYYGNKYQLKEVFLNVFKEIGVIAPSCKKVGVSRSTFYRWLTEDQKFNDSFIDATEESWIKNKDNLKHLPEHKRHGYLKTCIEMEE